MANIKNYIFNRKLLLRELARNSEELEEKYIEKIQIINGYVKRLKKNTIDNFSEIEFQERFLVDIFANLLDYIYKLDAQDKWNLRREQTTKIDSTKPDGILGFGNLNNNSVDVRVVIELKDSQTDLDIRQHRINDSRTPVGQAFSYAPKSGKNCKWIIVSNFRELRLYHSSDQSEYEYFDLTKLDDLNEFKRFYFILSCNNLIQKEGLSRVDILYQNNIAEEKEISQQFYQQYSDLRIHLYQHLKKNNPQINEYILLEKTQKLLDRFIFVCFCEDKGLLKERIFRSILEMVSQLPVFSRWEAIKNLFYAINQGDQKSNINKFDGELFAKDEILDNLSISDEIFDEMAKIADWDFDSELNVNILGHIFEKSISDIEQIKADIEGNTFDKKKGKRKKEGIFYTPEYITKYIVRNAVGGWLEDRKKELGINNLPKLIEKDYKSVKLSRKSLKYNRNIKEHIAFWEAYKKRLMNIKVLDPACGSGAFLNQTFDFLHREGQRVNEILAKLSGGQMDIFYLDKYILSNNIYGVDLNTESVEITKLSLWLKTANKNSPLTVLDNNIKCGNSLIDEPKVAGIKAFKWGEEFPEIMKNGGFDVVIGNPPYVYAREKISENEKIYYNNFFKTSEYQLNTFVLFFEKSVNLTKKEGFVGLIIPNSFLKISSMSKLRKFLLDSGSMKFIVQLFGYSFENISIETIISIFQKGIYDENVKILNISNKQDISMENYYDVNIADWKEDSEFRFQVSLKKEDRDLINKIKKFSCPLEEKFEVRAGLKAYEAGKGIPKQTSKDVRKRPYDYNYKYNKSTFMYLAGKDISRYNFNWSGTWLRYGENLAAPRTFNIFKSPRVLIREITSKHPKAIIGTFCDKIFLNNLSIINVLNKENNINDLKCLLLILNSSLMSYYFIKTNPKSVRSMFPKIILKDLRRFPIFLPGGNNTFIETADKMLTLNNQLQEGINKFIRFITSQFRPKKISNRLKEFYNLYFNEFVNELKKQKVSLTKKDEFELMSLFEEQKEKVLALQKEVYQTDQQLDLMVYKLYNLTYDEIKIIDPEFWLTEEAYEGFKLLE